MINFIINFLIFFTMANDAIAGGFIVTALAGKVFAASFIGQVIAFGINMIASSIVSKIFAPDMPTQSNLAAQQPNPGSRQQIAPAGDNKLPVVYGKAFLGGVITDLSITNDNQNIYWVMSLCEVTNTETGGTPDVITFGDVYWGGKKCIFDGTDLTKVTGLLDESTGETQDISGYMNIYLYRNGSNQPANSSQSAISVMSASGLIYYWDASKLMSNCAFAIIKLKYNQDRNLTGLSQTRFEVTNSRTNPGDCFLDYLTSTRYGAAINTSLIDTTSLTALNTYSSGVFSYTTYSGGTSSQPRFQFNGTLDTNLKIMQNIQAMADCCDCLVKYNEITGKWGVIVQTPTYTVAMALNDSNIISAITVTPIDLANSFNVIECKFPDGSNKDSFNSATFNLATVNPALLYPNEPVNKQSVNLYLTNNSVTAQYLANRMLEAAREDLQVQFEINYIGLQLEAGDIVSVTNANYGWVNKLYRIAKVTEKFSDTGEITASLNLLEYNPSVYDDKNVTEFTPAPNTGIGSPVTFGTIPAPVVVNALPSVTNPAFSVRVTTSSAGITQYAEVWYSAYSNPTPSQYIFAGTTEINSNGNPYNINYVMPDVQLFNIPTGDWYFFSRMINAIATSDFSPASTKFEWRPTTFQYVNRYVAVAYADDINGSTNFSFNPANRLYYGLVNQDSTTPPATASSYKWYLADPAFGTNKYLAYTNRTGRKFSFDTDFAAYAAGTAAFVPTTTSQFDFRIWSALPNGVNIIDLDESTGQTIKTGTTTTGTGQVKIVNTNDGQVVAALDQFLDFGGPSTFTTTPTSITVDIYGRVVGFATPDNFYMTIENFTATSGQTVFSVTRNANYRQGQCWVFQNGILLDEADYTDTGGSTGTVTLTTGATLNDNITIISFRAISSSVFYNHTYLNVLSVAGATVTWNSANMPYQYIDVGSVLTFANTGSPTQYTVSSVNYATRQITFTTTVAGVLAGANIYEYRGAGSSYRAFSRYEATLTNASVYEPTDWDFQSGYELPFLNGSLLSDQDYDIVGNEFTRTPNISTGKLSIIQFNANNLTTPVGTPVNVVTYSVANQTGYAFVYTTGALSIYANGARLIDAIDYTSATNSYTLTTAYTDVTTILQQQSFARTGAA